MSWLRLTPSRSAARARSAWSVRGMRTSSLPLGSCSAAGSGISRCRSSASANQVDIRLRTRATASSGVAAVAEQPGSSSTCASHAVPVPSPRDGDVVRHLQILLDALHSPGVDADGSAIVGARRPRDNVLPLTRELPPAGAASPRATRAACVRPGSATARAPGRCPPGCGPGRSSGTRPRARGRRAADERRHQQPVVGVGERVRRGEPRLVQRHGDGYRAGRRHRSARGTRTGHVQSRTWWRSSPSTNGAA